jgi:hypothetical protein
LLHGIIVVARHYIGMCIADFLDGIMHSISVRPWTTMPWTDDPCWRKWDFLYTNGPWI